MYYPGSDELSFTTSPYDSDSEYESGPVQRILIPSDDEEDDELPMPKKPITILKETKELPIYAIDKHETDYHIGDTNDLEEIHLEEIDLKGTEKEKQFGGAKKSYTRTEDLDFDTDIDLDFDVDQDEIEGLKSKISNNKKRNGFDDDDLSSTEKERTNEGTESEYEDNELELDVIDEPIDLDISKVVFRSKKVLVPDEKKVYQPQVQKNEFFKYLLEKYIPNKQLRKNNFLINQVHKINNRIVDLKDELINVGKNLNSSTTINERVEDAERDDDDERDDIDENEKLDTIVFNKGKKPILDSYMKNDYRNKFLIPVVLDRKKLYFPNQVSDYHYEFYSQNSNILNKNYQQVINELNEMIEQKGSSKISSITYFQLEKAINDMMKPYKINDDSKLLGFIGNNADKIPENELPFTDFTGLVIRYNKDGFKSQGIDFQESEIEGYNIKPPLIYYIDKLKQKSEQELYEEGDDEEELFVEDIEKEWMMEEQMETSLENKPNVKKIQDGDRFNIIGYLALPLKHAFNQHQIYYDSLSGLYENYKNTTGIIEKNISDIDDSDINRPEKTNLLLEREQPTFYYCSDKNGSMKMTKEEYLNRLIPDFKEICQAHRKELKAGANWSDLEKVIESYGYDIRYLNVEDWKMLSNILDKNLEGQTYNLSKRWLDYQKYLQNESPTLKGTAKLFPLIDKFMLEGLENFYDKYPSLNNTVDSDTNRLYWALQKEDHGKLLELLLTRNQLIDDERNINRGELDRELAKRKQELEILEGRYKRDLQIQSRRKETPNGEEGEGMGEKQCMERPKYQVAKTYPSLIDLEKDNYVIAKTNVGNREIQVGQYAIVKENRKVYIRRKLPNNKEIWDESKITIDKLNELVSKECETPAFDNLKDLMKGDDCQFQKDDSQCHSGHLDRVYRQMKHSQKLVAVLEAELEEINNIEIKKRKLEQVINKTKSFLSSKNNLERLERENRIQAYRQIIEDVKKAQNKVKDCPHYQVLNYFLRMKHITLQEKYSITSMILKKFQDVSPIFLKELIFDESLGKTMEESIEEYGRIDVINPNLNFNWTYCSLCHQKLVCNHYLYASSIIKEEGELDEKKLKDLYGIEVEQNYNCKVCGEFIVSSDEIDMDGFVKKADGDGKMVTRELIDQEAERRQVRKNILDELLDDVESKMDEKSKDMKLFLNTVQMLKSLVRVNLLPEDEEDLVSYIKSYPFLSREYFKEYIKKTAPTQQLQQNPQLLEFKATQFYYMFAVFDITARFMIILQTSLITYNISNDICVGHLGGYPLGLETDLTTVKYFGCLLEKMSGLPEYSFMNKEQNMEAKFMGRLKLMNQNQNIQQKYKQAIEHKSNKIINDDPFNKSPTNIWVGYRPNMGVLDAGWNPRNQVSVDGVNKIVVSKFRDFMSDLRENMSHYGSKIFDLINNVISREQPAVMFHKEVRLGNSCCLTKINPDLETSYYDFICNKEPSVRVLIKTLGGLDKLKSKIERAIFRYGEPPTFMKVDVLPRIDPYYYVNQEYKLSSEMKNKLFLLYVDEGINKGLSRIFNYFDICTLSGNSKQEIQEKEYSDADYHSLLNDIHKKGKLTTIKPVDLSHQKIITQNIDNYMFKNANGVKSSNFLSGFLSKLKDLINDQMPEEKKDIELEKHWSRLNQQITEEIETLYNHLSTIKKEPTLKNRLFKLGDYNKIYQEDDLMSIDKNKLEEKVNSSFPTSSTSSSSDDENMYRDANNKRYIRMEKNLKNYLFNFFRSSLAIIKNNAYDKYRSFDMNPQWKYLIYYRDYQELFGKIYDIFMNLTQDLDLFIGTGHKYFNYQNACLLFKCIMFIVLNQMIEYKPDKQKGKNIQFTTKVDQEDIDMMVDLAQIPNEVQKSEDDDIRNFNLKVFSDQKIIVLYIYQIIERIIKEEDEFNQLTQNYMTIVTTRKQEERVRKNLNLIAILAQDGRKDLRRVILDQKRLGLIDYEDFEDILNQDIQAGEDKPAFDRDMELLDELNENEDIDGHIIEEKRKQKMNDYDVDDDEYSYVAGEDDDIEDF
jgi:hypothetical protein